MAETSVDSASAFLYRLTQAFPTWLDLKPWLLGGPWPVRRRVAPWSAAVVG